MKSFSGAKPGSIQWHLDSAVDCLRAIADMGKKAGSSEIAANWLQQHGFVPGKVPGKEINPALPKYQDLPLWVVYGPDCFPTLLCCKVQNHPQCGLTIWGYSIYRRQPGFRTLGSDLQEWLKEVESPKFFERQDDALAHLAKITTPKMRCD